MDPYIEMVQTLFNYALGIALLLGSAAYLWMSGERLAVMAWPRRDDGGFP